MQLKKNSAVLQNFADATQHEWLETNGLGGYASSSIIGANTRRYHGLLVAAVVPPAERMVLLSKLEETINIGNKKIELSANLYAENTIHPSGHHYLKSFTKDFFPEWIYESDEFQLKKTVGMIHGENTVVLVYDVIKATTSFTLDLLPLIAARGYHSLQHEGHHIHWDVNFNNGVFSNQPDGKTNLYISVPGALYQHEPRWFNNFKYNLEKYRGLDYSEDLFNHGIFSVEMKEGDSLGIIISTDNPEGKNAQVLLSQERGRRKKLLEDQPDDETLKQLILAADQFIVKRDENLKTVIAGYHWFTDWGRDTMISLPGLTLSTGRYEDAEKIIAAFAKSVSMGMLPNRFQDNGDSPEYNNVDGTLWYFIAVHKYLQATGNKKFVLTEILPVLNEIIQWHYKGTRYNIHVDDDGLLFAGDAGQQLTWMDAKIGDWVVTPRMGKPVEIQALWYNALRIYSGLLKLNKDEVKAAEYNNKAELTKDSFNKLFWNKPDNYLFDVIDDNNIADKTLRPNQLFAISLPFVLIEDEKAKQVLRIVEDQLYAPVGLKSLPANDPHYIPVYGGDQWHRDSSYHQGTVWSWLLGPYIDAIIKVRGKEGKSQALKIIQDFKYHLNEGCIGSVSEIFDADEPHHPRGCIAQAWGVAELLRVIEEYKLFEKTKPKRIKSTIQMQ